MVEDKEDRPDPYEYAMKMFSTFYSTSEWEARIIIGGGVLTTVLVLVLFLPLCNVGCVPKREPTASAIPVASQSSPLSIADTSRIPSMPTLSPGRSAVLMDDVVVPVRVPAQGERIYEGTMMIPRGSIVINPVKEAHDPLRH